MASSPEFTPVTFESIFGDVPKLGDVPKVKWCRVCGEDESSEWVIAGGTLCTFE